jgi:serine/threonine protein kinase/Flp pilus assembly protein TadD
MTEPPLPEESIFAQALEITSAAGRAAFLDRACGHNQALRAEVEALLRAQERSGDLLDLPEDVPVTTNLPAGEDPGTVIGPYKLLEPIGEGGMGSVWMAEQTDPIQRRVAVKVIKEGMDSRQVLARFEAERQALALMEHPNIAKVLDAGKTPSSHPYFVMELVKGKPITNYCDEKRLGVRERLTLFGDVCRAVQHAHQKGIIHRDLKPSNVLVAPYDGKPVVKVIDFGVAKATGQRLTDKTLFTGFGAVVGTPEYMSPEQAEINNRDVDTRSDIYSLGVLLYELLTGSTPLTRKRLKEAALLEVLRVIREEEPPRPSMRLSESKDSLPSISAQRQTEPAKLTKLVRGELDWIVMKALEKDRNRRYETANAFATDVERYLADEPVQACPPSVWYRLRKLARRNRGRFVAAGVLGLALLLAGGGVGWTALDRAARQTKAANELEVALDRAEFFQGLGKRAEALAVIERAELLAGQAGTGSSRDRWLTARKERLAAVKRDQDFIPRVEDIRLRAESQFNLETSKISRESAFPEYREALRHYYGVDIGTGAPNQVAAIVQGRPESVRASLVAALDSCLRLAPKRDAQTREWLLATLTAADSDPWRVRARRVILEGDKKALKALARAVDVRTQPPSFLLSVTAGLAQESLELLEKQGLATESLGASTQLQLLRRIQREYPTDLWANQELGMMLAASGRPGEAIRYFTAAVALRPDNAGIYVNRGMALLEAREVDASIADFSQALALAPSFVMAYNDLGIALKDKGKLDEAVACYQKAIAIDPKSAFAHYNLGDTFEIKGRFDEAIAEYQETIRLKNDLVKAHCKLGNVLVAKGKLDEAIGEYQETIRLKKDYAEAHSNLGIVLRAQGKLEEAVAAYRAAIRLKPDLASAHSNLGDALLDQGKLEDAIAECRTAIRLKPEFAEAHANLALALHAQWKLKDALAAFRRAAEVATAGSAVARDMPGQIRRVEQQIALDGRLPAVLKGNDLPRDGAERLDFARLCYDQGLYAAAARFWAQALEANPTPGNDGLAGHRYNAACAAALAGCGQGKDADKLDGRERGRLRRQSLDWLRADLDEWRRLLDKEPDKVRSALVPQMQHWLADPDIAGVRGPNASAQLPEVEREPWRKLWDDVANTLARARASKIPEKKPAAQ